MSFFVWYELVCRFCANTGCGEFTRDQIGRRALREAGLRAGWRFDADGDVTCPVCISQRRSIE